MVNQVTEALRDEQKSLFVAAYAKSGVIKPACDVAGIHRGTYSSWRKNDPDFDRDCATAFQESVDDAESEFRERGMHGVKEPVMYKGRPVYETDPVTGYLLLDDNLERIPCMIKRPSDRCLEVYLRAHRVVYSEKRSMELTGPGGGPIELKAITVNYVLPKGKTIEDYPDDPKLIENQILEPLEDPLEDSFWDSE